MTKTIERIVKIMLKTENDMARVIRINMEVSIPITNTGLLVITEIIITKHTTVHLAHPNHILMREKHTQIGITEIKGARIIRKSMQSQINIRETEHHTMGMVTEDMHRITIAINTLDMEVIMVRIHHKNIRTGIMTGQLNLHFKDTVRKVMVEIIIEVTATADTGIMTNNGLSNIMKGTMALSTMVARVTQPTPSTATKRSQLITKKAMAVTTTDRMDTTVTGMAEDLQAT